MGVSWRCQVRGDFQATARYNVLSTNRPEKGNGVGIELMLELANDTKDAFSFARITRPKEGLTFHFLHTIAATPGKRVRKQLKLFPTTFATATGQLRLEREGPMLIASVSEGMDSRFREIHRIEIGTSEVQTIRFAGSSGGDKDAQLDVRLMQFQLQGDNVRWTEKTNPSEASSGFGLFDGVVIAYFCILIFFLIRLRRNSMA